MTSKKTRAVLEAENRILRRYRYVEMFATIIRDILRYGTLGWIAYCGYLTAKVLAGQTTDANILVDVLGDIRVSSGLVWIFGAAGVGYGWRQRKLRRDTVEQVSQHNAELERAIDPKRTSSQLTPRGDTQPEDRI